MNVNNKRILILSTLLFVAGNMPAATGVYVENKTGQDIYAQIDLGTTYGWTQIKNIPDSTTVKKEQLPFLPSEKGALLSEKNKRRVYWKVTEDLLRNQSNLAQKKQIERIYKTDEYALPEKITIKKDGEYEMVSTGLAGLPGKKDTKKVNQIDKSEVNGIKISGAILQIQKRIQNKTASQLKEEIKTQETMIKQAEKSAAKPEQLTEYREFIKAANDKMLKLIKENSERITLEITKNPKTGFTTKLPKQEEALLIDLINKKYDLKIKDLIIKFNLDPDYQIKSRNIIFDACSNGLVETTRELIKKGATTNFITGTKDTPLHNMAMFAAKIDTEKKAQDIKDIIDILLNKDPKMIDAKNHSGKTPKELAKIFKSDAIFNYLQELEKTIHSQKINISKK